MERIPVHLAASGISLVDLYNRISQTGWSVKKVKFDKGDDEYVAEAKNPLGETVAKTGPTEDMAVRNLLLAVERKRNIRSSALSMLSMWRYNWTDKLQPIAEAYAKAPVYDPKAAAAFKALADDSTRRADVLRKQLHIEEVHDPQPYPHARAMMDDIHKRQHYVVSKANTEHPIWTPEQHVAYRIAHDVLGHAVSGGDYTWEGENKATAAHMPLLSKEAQKALFTEAIGRAAYDAHYRSLGPQKIAALPDFIEPAQAQEGVSEGFSGVHPSQSRVPVAIPAVKPPAPVENVVPHEQEALGLMPHAGAAEGGIDPTLRDPNEGWSSGIAPEEQNDAYNWHGDPLQADEVTSNAEKIKTNWSKLRNEDRMKQAIVNAFRVVLLSPKKDLHWNTVHYQDLQSVPATETDPLTYWQTLENARQNWNVKNFGEGARYTHRPYGKLIPQFEQIIYQRDPEQGWGSAKERAERELMEWEQEEQDKLMEEDDALPVDKQLDHWQVEKLAFQGMKRRLETFIAEHKNHLDHPGQQVLAAAKVERPEEALFEHEPEEIPQLEPQVEETPKLSRYGAFMGSHLKAIAQVSLHVDELLKAALEDVKEHDGTGHHFRAAVLQLGIPGLGPKTASFAWLLLQPDTSQLGTIDTHMLDVLGKTEKEYNNRDYFKFERELAAGRDAAGYGHVPLGQFQWGMWDLKRTGQGSHQDHSGLKVLNPDPHEAIDWQAKEKSLKGDAWGNQAEEWWKNTQPARDQVGEEWDQNIGGPKNRVPYQQSVIASWKVAAQLRTPWFTHPITGERVTGAPGSTIMQHAVEQMHLSTPEIWSQVSEAGKA